MSEEVWLVGVPGAAARLGICTRGVFTLISRGELASLRVGGRRMIPSSVIDEFIAARVTNRACDGVRVMANGTRDGVVPGRKAPR